MTVVHNERRQTPRYSLFNKKYKIGRETYNTAQAIADKYNFTIGIAYYFINKGRLKDGTMIKTIRILREGLM